MDFAGFRPKRKKNGFIFEKLSKIAQGIEKNYYLCGGFVSVGYLA
jgi:hypothetical protein